MTKIKQIIPVPRGRKYYAVYRDETASCGYAVERLDFLVLVKRKHEGLIVEGLSGYMEPVRDSADNYFGTFSEDVLKYELPEVWEEIKNCGAFQDDTSQLERFIAEQRDKLNTQSEQIDLLKEKIAELEKGKSDTAQTELTPTEKLYEAKTVDFNNCVIPPDNAEISETQSNNEARSIALDDLRFAIGKKLDYRTIRALNASGVKTLGDVADKTFDELLQIKFIGRSAMNKISAVLRSHGLTLKDEISVYLKRVLNLGIKGKTVTEISEELNMPKILAAKYLKFVQRELHTSRRRSKP